MSSFYEDFNYANISSLTDWSQAVAKVIYSTNTDATAPSNNGWKANSSNLSTATAIYIDANSVLNVDTTFFIENLKSGDTVHVAPISGFDSDYYIYNVTANPTNNDGWYTIPVSISIASGTALINGDTCYFSVNGFREGWRVQSSLLIPNDNIALTEQGLILNTANLIGSNGTIEVEYNNIDSFNGNNNLIVFRYTDYNQLVFVSLYPGAWGAHIGIGFNGLAEIIPNVELFDTSGNLLSQNMPTTGKIVIEFTGNIYDFTVYDAVGALHGTGQYVDSLSCNINPGYVGFGSFDNGQYIGGWDSINVNDADITIVPPVITSFSATNYTLNLGECSDLGWVITSGNDTTTVELFPSSDTVSLIDTSATCPTETTTYGLSAWNSAGSDYEELTITVIETFPIIELFENDGPLSEGQSATLTWVITSGTATSAFIDNDIGWIDPYSSSGTIVTSPLYNDITYTLTAYDEESNTATASTFVDVQGLPTGLISVDGMPTCSGTFFDLTWETTNATSAYISNGVGMVTPVSGGTISLSAGEPTSYTLSAINDISIDTDNVNVIIWYQDPVADAGEDVFAISTNGQPVSIALDGSGSYDLDNIGVPLIYEWYDSTTPLSGTPLHTGITYINDYNAESTTELTLKVTDNCGKTSTDTVSVTVESRIAPNATAQVQSPEGVWTDSIIINAPTTISLKQLNSSDPDGIIVKYEWFHKGTIIATYNSPSTIVSYSGISTYGLYTFTLRVTDNDDLIGEDSCTVLVTDDANPIANAGLDQEYCFGDPTTINLDGSDSENPINSEIVWYEYNLSAFGQPNISATIDELYEISATFNTNVIGTNDIILTVSASNGYTDSDVVEITICETPRLSAYSENGSLECGNALTNINLSAYSDNAITPRYMWTYDDKIVYGQFPTLVLGKGEYDVDVFVTDMTTNCVSDTDTITFSITGSDLAINDFIATPHTSAIYDVSAFDVQLYWNVTSATNVYIDGIEVDPTSGTVNVEVTEPGGIVGFTLTATDGDCTIVDTIYGNYIFTNTPIDLCMTRHKYIKTYGINELKFGEDRYINLVNYLPEYVRGTDTETIVQEFEDYLNNMYTGQRNYTWDENELEVTVYNTPSTKQWTSCNDISGCDVPCDGDCTNYASSAVENQYSFVGSTSAGVPIEIIPTTPADSVGEVFINNMCNIKSDKISILDKIFRLTELFDPDLIPENLIQNYAENLGYSAGINREIIGDNRDDDAKSIEQRRYLRFMVRNLPNWYQIKSSKPSIKIMMYSFGLLGDFVYYYTKCYSDSITNPSAASLPGTNANLCNLSNLSNNGLDNTLISSLSAIDEYDCTSAWNDCNYDAILEKISNDGIKTVKELAELRSCMQKFKFDTQTFVEKVGQINGITSNDWMLSNPNNENLDENLSSISENSGYFSSPHFKLWVDIAGSEGNYSTDIGRQRMISLAIKAIQPINTVFDGVAVHWKHSPAMMYCKPVHRVRKYIKIVSDNPLVGCEQIYKYL